MPAKGLKIHGASRSRFLRSGVKVLITLGLLAALAGNTDLDGVGRAAGNLGWQSMTASIALLLSLSVVQASRWHAILVAMGARIRYRAAWTMVLLGFFFSQLLPTSIGGDVARVWKLRQAGVPLARALNSVLIDRVTALIAAVIITLAGASLLFSLFPGVAVRYLVFGAIAAIAAALLALLLAARVAAVRQLLDRVPIARLTAVLKDVVDDAAAVLLDPRTLSVTLALSLFIHVAVSGTVWLIATDIGARVDFLDCVVLVPLVILVSMLPVSIAGWGMREGAMVVALGSVGVDRATALTTSVAFGIALAASGIPGGLMWLYGRRPSVEAA